MKLGTIDNSGINTLDEYFRITARDALAIDWASAFITDAGIERVLYLLTAAARSGRVRVLTGIYQGFTEPAALQKLLTAGLTSKGRLEVRVSSDPHFHWKAYHILRKSTAHVVVGSSNLTQDGLSTSGELNLVLSMPRTSLALAELCEPFERHWQHKSFSISSDWLAKYKSWRSEDGVRVPTSKVPKRLFRSQETEERTPPAPTSFHRTYITGELSDETEDVLSEATDWQQKGYDYFTDGRTYSIGDRVVFFDFLESKIKLIQITDFTITPHKTADGTHFAAHKLINGIPVRKFSRQRWASLKTDALIHSKAKAQRSQKISPATFDAFVANLKARA